MLHKIGREKSESLQAHGRLFIGVKMQTVHIMLYLSSAAEVGEE